MSLESAFPGLLVDGYSVTSAATNTYNCIAWAAGVNSVWWDPATGYYWPDGAPREHAIEALKAVFAGMGFVDCDSADQERGFDKIALYGDLGEWTHAARMLENGKWTSKLGPQEDIEHGTPAGLAGSVYGNVVCIMKRPTPKPKSK
jgi:hypothetical protein